MVSLALLAVLGCGDGAEVDSGVDAGSSCEGRDFVYAPPPTALAGGMVVVPIDVVSVDGKLTFDMATESALGQATLTFMLGDASGHAAFDLHQVIDYAELNGVALAIDEVARQVFSPELPNHGMRVIAFLCCTSDFWDGETGSTTDITLLPASLGSELTHILLLTQSPL